MAGTGIIKMNGAPPYVPPFSAHTALAAQHETFLGGGNPNGLATLTFINFNPQLVVPVTHTKIDADYVLEFGRSSTTAVERCEFRASLFSGTQSALLTKGLLCNLQVKPGQPVIRMQLWSGGLVEGGEIYRFMLVDANYKG